MKKAILGKKLGRNTNQRKALFKGLISSLIMSDRIQTTEAKAKAIKPEIEKLVTKAKQGGNSAMRVLEKSLNPEAFERIIKDVAPSFKNRQGGYTRLIKLGKRLGDNASMVVIEWTEAIKRAPLATETKSEKQQKKVSKKTSVKKLSVRTKNQQKNNKGKKKA
jgi:large subunit ribosomal protein L17